MNFAPFVLSAVVPAAASSSRGLQDTNTSTVANIVTANGNYSTLVTAANSIVGLVEPLSDPTTDITLFAPNNDAFAAMDQALLEKLLTPPWQGHLKSLLMYHAAEGTYLSTDIPPEGITLTMMNAQDLDISSADGTVVFSNDFVDEPFSSVESPDLTAANGVVHGVSGVFLAPFLFYDLVEAVVTPDLASTLIQLIQLAGLEDTLRNGNFTLFAPTDEAFDALDDELIATVTEPDNVEMLRKLLLYHVTPTIIPTSLFNSTDYVTVEGSSVTVLVDNTTSTVMINGANLVTPDILASNGIVHVIDEVLVPPALQPASAPTATEPMPSSMGPSPPSSEPMPTTMEPSPTAVGPTSAAFSLSLGGLLVSVGALVF